MSKNIFAFCSLLLSLSATKVFGEPNASMGINGSGSNANSSIIRGTSGSGVSGSYSSGLSSGSGINSIRGSGNLNGSLGTGGINGAGSSRGSGFKNQPNPTTIRR